jgi:hypothetical protein
MSYDNRFADNAPATLPAQGDAGSDPMVSQIIFLVENRLANYLRYLNGLFSPSYWLFVDREVV